MNSIARVIGRSFLKKLVAAGLLALAALCWCQASYAEFGLVRVGYLSVPRDGPAATSAGDYALFANGGTVDIYNVATDQWSTASLSQARTGLAATTVGNLALFAGGTSQSNNGSLYSSVVDVFNSSTGQWSTASLSQARSGPAATTVGNYALFAGGRAGAGYSSTVDLYNGSTGQWSTVSFPHPRESIAATSVGNYALFAGGVTFAGGFYDTVDIFDSSTGKWSTASLSQARDGIAATAVGHYAIFGGGGVSFGGSSNKVDIFDADTGRWSTTTLSQGRSALAATTVGNLALFGGGLGPGYSKIVDVFDGSTGGWSTISLSQARASTGATSVGGFAFFGGGWANAPCTTVDIFGPASPACVSITSPTSGYTALRGNAVNFTATATTSAPGVSVASVEFFDGGSPLGPGVYDSAAGTWTFGWDTTGAAAGIHNFTAVATDDLGAQASSPATVVNIVIVRPTVAITSPTGTYATAVDSTVNLVATASTSAPGAAIASVQFYDGAALLAPGVFDGGSGTWTYSWDTTGLPPSLHKLTAVAADTLAVQATSTPVSIAISVGQPTVAITSPTSTYSVPAGVPVVLTATASSPNNVSGPGGAGIALGQVSFDVYADISFTALIWNIPLDSVWCRQITNGFGLDGKTVVCTIGPNQKRFGMENQGYHGGGDSDYNDIDVLVTFDADGLVTQVQIIQEGGAKSGRYDMKFNGALVCHDIDAHVGEVFQAVSVPGQVASVVFYDGAAKLGNGAWDGAANTWTYTWNTPGRAPGLHYVTARATDAVGLSATSTPATAINLTAPMLPVVAITSPTSTYAVAKGVAVKLVATASTSVPGVSVTSVRFYDGPCFIDDGVYDAVSGTWKIAWQTRDAPEGLHSITASAVDSVGGWASSWPGTLINVVADNLSVSITSPTGEFTAVNGPTINFVATASTTVPGGSVVSVKFYDDGSLLGPGDYDAASGTWRYALDTSRSVEESHSVFAIAVDNFGLKAYSNSVTIMPPMGTVTFVCTYTSTNWAIYAMDSVGDNDGIGTACLKIGNVLTAVNVSPKADNYLGDDSGVIDGTFGFAQPHDAYNIGGGVFEIICGQNPANLLSDNGYFLRHLGQQTVSYTVTNDNGSTTIKTVSPTQMTLASHTGYFVKIAQGTLAAGAIPTIVPYGDGAIAGANDVVQSRSASFFANVQAFVLAWPAPTVTITSPTSTYAAQVGSTVSFTATASTAAPGGSIAGVQFYDGTKLLGSGAFDSASATWTCSWNTGGAAIGLHYITAKATDNIGQAAVSAPATVVKICIPCDANGDGSVDGLDYNAWQNGYQQPGATFATGDFNGDGSVDGLDYNVLQNNYTPSATCASGATVLAPAAAGAAIAPHLVTMTPAAGGTAGDMTVLTLVFDCAVEVGAGAVEVSGAAGGENRAFMQAYDAATRTLTLTWTRPLAPDVYTVRVIADFVTAAGGGVALDGEVGDPAAPTLPSGDGAPGGDAWLEFDAR